MGHLIANHAHMTYEDVSVDNIGDPPDNQGSRHQKQTLSEKEWILLLEGPKINSALYNSYVSLPGCARPKTWVLISVQRW